MTRRLAAILLALATAGWLASEPGHAAGKYEPLPRIGPAPAFTLTDQNGRPLSLAELRGKVVVVSFLYTSCADTCALLTARLASLRSRLGAEFGRGVYFVSITVDPERDTPPVLRRYAEGHGVRAGGWGFLTGTPAQIGDVARGYGVAFRRTPGGDVDHTFLTSLVDRGGILRVQYLGTRFREDELLGDIRSLLREGRQG